MSVELATAYISLVPSMGGAETAITRQIVPAAAGAGTQAGRQAGGAFLGGMKGMLGAAAVVAVIGGAVAFARNSIESLARIETINTQTATVIASTGGAAGVSAGEIEALAGQLEGLTATEAESIQEGANLLLTFKNIQNEAGAGNDIFDQSVVSLTDMARALGTDPQSAAIQLGKALNDPVKGITALARVGITFTDQQREQIEAMVEAGDVAGAQSIILEELNSQFGGSAAAYAGTYAGKMELLGHSFGTLGETILTAAMPALTRFAEVATTAVTWLTENQWALIALGAVIGTTLVVAFIAWTVSIWGATIALLANPVTWIVIAIIALIAALVLLILNWDAVAAFITETWNNALNWAVEALSTFGQNIRDFFINLPGNILGWLGDLNLFLYNSGMSLINGLINGILDNVPGLRTILNGITDLIPDWKGPPERDAVLLRPAGQLIMQGLGTGIQSSIPNLRSTLRGVSDVVAGQNFSAGAGFAAGAPEAAGGSAGGLTVHNHGVDANELAMKTRAEFRDWAQGQAVAFR